MMQETNEKKGDQHSHANNAADWPEIDAFFERQVKPIVNAYEQAGELPASIVERLKALNLANALLDRQRGGLGFNYRQLWRLHATAGRYCASIRSLLTVHSMVLLALTRFATPVQKQFWYDASIKQQYWFSFALTEPEAGTNAQNIALLAEKSTDHYRLNGTKHWITGALYANAFLVFGKSQGKACAWMVARDTPGLSIEPQETTVTRASGLGLLHFNDCEIPAEQRLGKEGAGLDWIAPYCLDLGRFSVAAGGLGIAETALALTLEHVKTRRSGGGLLADQELVQRRIADMMVEVQSCRLLGEHCARLKDQNHLEASIYSTMAKFKASQVANLCAQHAMQLGGAVGFSKTDSRQRLLQEARTLTVIEGPDDVNALQIAKAGLRGQGWLGQELQGL